MDIYYRYFFFVVGCVSRKNRYKSIRSKTVTMSPFVAILTHGVPKGGYPPTLVSLDASQLTGIDGVGSPKSQYPLFSFLVFFFFLFFVCSSSSFFFSPPLLLSPVFFPPLFFFFVLLSWRKMNYYSTQKYE